MAQVSATYYSMVETTWLDMKNLNDGIRENAIEKANKMKAAEVT
jgi:hypothetical protein